MLSHEIKEKALDIGFSSCGITSAKTFSIEREKAYKACLQNEFHANMRFLEQNLEKRMNPKLLFEDTKSIIVVLLNYHNPTYHKNKKSTYSFSEYALGIDYHIVVKNKLSELLNFIQNREPNSKNKCFVDSAPVLEKYLANQAGLGSIGKNTLLLTKKGSYYFIGEIFTNLHLSYDSPIIEDYCLGCEQCIKACPSNALYATYCLNSSRCISYHSIESRNEVPKEIKIKMGKQVYGCDICQQVCPYNKNAEPTRVKEFSIKNEFLEWTDTDWQKMNMSTFEQSFFDSVLYRAGYEKVMGNMLGGVRRS